MVKSKWRSMKDAPKDGTVIVGRNKAMKARGSKGVHMSWGDYTTSWGRTYTDWRTEFTPHKFFPTLPGNLICPDEWKPL